MISPFYVVPVGERTVYIHVAVLINGVLLFNFTTYVD